MEKILFVTAMFYKDLPSGAKLMLESAAYHGIDVMQVGRGQKYEGWYVSKGVRLWEQLKNLRGYDYIVSVDGSDTLFATGAGELLHKYKQHFDGQFVIGGETYCWPCDEELAKAFPKEHGRFRNPCTGFWMAPWSTFLKTFDAYVNMKPTKTSLNGWHVSNNDQFRWIIGRAEGRLHYEVDHRNLLSFSFNGTDGRWHLNNDIIWGKRPRIRLTNNFPCTFHANGPQKWRLKDVWEMLSQ